MPRPSAVAVIAVLALPAAAAHGTPITPGPPSVDPAFTGAAATAQRATPTIAPQNPFLAKNPNNNIHNDTWMTDAYPSRPGPLGSNLDAFNGAYQLSVCGSLTFDKKGHIVSVCPSTLYAPQARIIDPDTLEVLASYDLPTAPDPPGTKQYQNFTGGGYFFLDQKDRMWSATKTSHLFVL